MADTNKIRMEIIYSKKYERANIRFSDKPSEECRSALKDEGWSYSSKNNVWYPKNEAAANSLKFANELKLQFYPDTEVNPDEIMVEDVVNSYIEVPESLSKKLSSRNTIWFKGEDKTVKDMVDYLAEINMSDFSLEKKDNNSLYIQGYDNGMKPRGRMEIDMVELQYLCNKMNNEIAKIKLQQRFKNLTGIDLFENTISAEVNNSDNKNTELTTEDIEICKKVIPSSQFRFTQELSKGEEGEFFKNKLKEIADTYRRINVDHELINKDGTHNVGFRYFLGQTEIFLSEIDSNGIGFGYNILNGDLQMSEWGSTSLEEILSIPYMEMDYHVPEGITIEKMLYQEHPDYFSEYAPKEDLFNVINFTNWTYFNSEKISTKVYDVEISASLYEQLLPSEYKERSIKEDEVVCIQYRKSVVSEEQDQFLISKFNKNTFMLLQQKEIQIDDELKNKIKSICTSYIEPKNDISYTNEIIEKIKAAGINVEISADKIQEIIQLRKDINKMTARSGLYWNGKPYEYTMAEYALNSNLDIKWLNHFFGTTTSVIYQFNPINGGFQPQVAQERLQALLKTAERMSYTGDTVSSRSKLGKERLRTFEFFAEQIRNGNIGYFDRGAPISTDAPNWITVNETKIIDEPEYMFENGLVVGLAYENNIVLNPEYLSSNAAIHEYTHLWDAYTQKTNPELWGKGLEIFKDTKYWNEVISDPNYKDIKDDENLVLSEIHSRICGDMAETILERIAELDGEQTRLDAIDWDKEVWNYIAFDFNFPVSTEIAKDVHNFLSTPMKDLMASKNITISNELTGCNSDFMTQKKYYNMSQSEIDAIHSADNNMVFENTTEYNNEVHSSMTDYIARHEKKWKENPLSKEEFERQENKLKNLGQMEFDFDDPGVTQEVISAAEKERKRITEPVLNGEKTGMYVAFKEFEEKGVFDIKRAGATVKTSKKGGLTPTGWKQLQAAMEIYRSKKFETFRYIIINEKTGEIADQLAITSHMPNFCNVSKPNNETLKQVISRLEELGDDYKLAVCHNHPSGNTTESSFDRELTDSLDRSLRRNDGTNKFLGHIILDHDTFNLAVPSEARPGNCHWKTMETLQVTEIDRFTAEPKPEWAGSYVGGTSALKEVAIKINDTDNWNDEFIPVVFTNADRNISGVQYYSKNFFENESDKIRNEFQFAAMEAGAIGAFPVITDSLWEKLGKESTEFEAVMKAHVLNDAFTDVAFDHTTMTEKYDIEAGRNYYSFYRDQSDRKIDVASTWEPKVNPRLFPSEENINQTASNVGEAAKNYNASSNLFTRDFLKQYNFMPPVLLRENEAVVRCNPADLNPRYVRMDVPAGKSVDITIPKQFLMDSIMAGIKTEAERVIKYNDEHPDCPDKLQLAGMCLNEDNLFEQQKQLLKDNGINNPKDMIEAVNSMRQQLFFGENSIFNSIPVKDNSKEKEQEIEEEGFDR